MHGGLRLGLSTVHSRSCRHILFNLLLVAQLSAGFLHPGHHFMLVRGFQGIKSSSRSLLPSSLSGLVVLALGAGGEGQKQESILSRVFTDAAERRKVIDQETREREEAMTGDRNVLGGSLAICGTDPMTGFTREGCCTTGPMDTGSHTVCSVVTDEFLRFSRQRGNDLVTPRPQWGFPGLKAGDRWCLCASRWQEAFEQGMAPKVVLKATHMRALDVCRLEDLKAHAVDANENRNEL